MNPLVFIIPGLLLMSGVACFFLLPLPLTVRLVMLVADALAAVVVGFVLFRRFSGGR
jgi:hypothetical protein